MKMNWASDDWQGEAHWSAGVEYWRFRIDFGAVAAAVLLLLLLLFLLMLLTRLWWADVAPVERLG